MQPINEGLFDVIGISDLFDFFDQLTDRYSASPDDKYSFTSASKAASKLVAVFPVLFSTSISRDTMVNISKMVERKGCIILQLALMASNKSDAESGIEYFRKFHQNIDTGNMSYAEFIGALQNQADNLSESDNYIVSRKDINCLLQMINELGLDLYDNSYRPVSLNDYQITESDINAGRYDVSLRYITEDKKNSNTKGSGGSSKKDNDNKSSSKNKSNYNTTVINNYYGSNKKDEKSSDKDSKSDKKDDDKSKKQQSSSSTNHTPRKVVNRVPEFTQQDLKKSNEAVPSLLTIKFIDTKNDNAETSFLIGVKSKAIAANSVEIIRKIVNDNNDNKGLINLIRWSTGELKLIKDLILALDRNKDDIIYGRTKGSKEKLWKTLQSRAMKSKYYLSRGKVNYASAITTVVITSDDADYLYKEYNIDIYSVASAKRFMDSYNLLGFIIADDSTEMMKVLYDGDSEWEELAYRMLERETDSQYKKILNILAKR